MSEAGAASSGANTGQSTAAATGAPSQSGAPSMGQQAAASAPAATTTAGDGTAITGQHNQPTAQESITTEPAKEKKRLKDHLKTIFPDKEYTSDEDAEEDGINYINELSEYRNKNRDYNKKILDVFDSEPAVVDIIRDMSAGATFMEALAKNVDMDNIKPQEGDPDYNKWNQALTERQKKRAENETKAKQIDANIEFTKSEIAAFKAENQMDDTRLGEFADKVQGLLSDALMGKYSKDLLGMLYKGLNFEKAVEKAAAQGEIKGRNQNIKATIAKEETTGDGLPQLREGGELDQADKKPITPEQRLMGDIDKFNAKRKPLEAYLKEK